MSSLLKNIAGKVESAPLPNSVSNLGAKPAASGSPDAESPKKKDNPKYWQFYRVAGKTREAKFLQLPFRPETYDLYCIARTDNDIHNQFTSIIISNSDNPFWNENFTLDSRVVFKVLKFTVWMAYKSPSTGEVVNMPVGKVVIPRKFMKAKDEQCYMLVNASLEDKVSGSVQVQIKYRSPAETGTMHEFSVKVLKAKDLANGNTDINPYAVTHLLPDPNASTKKHFGSQHKTNNPVFADETVVYTAQPDEDPFKLDLHVSLWNKVSNEDVHTFLGHVTIPLGPLTDMKVIKKYFTLTTMKNDEFLSSRSKKAGHVGNAAADLVKSFTTDFPPLTERDHNFVGKTGGSNLGNCAFCNEAMNGHICVCSECRTMCHVKCQDKLPNTCGGYGVFRFTVDFTKFIALDLPNYEPILNLFKEDSYFILMVMGKVSNYRDEVSKCLLRVFDDQYVNFLKVVLRKEILDAESAQTLFRASSLASKALDTFMKAEGVEYLKTVLEGPLNLLNFATKPFELDPTRIAKNEKGEPVEDIAVNTRYLTQYTAMVLDSILQTADKMPASFKAVFATIQNTVGERFPDNDLTRYISISGFIFLRFYTPAIFGPTLFGLKIGVQDDKSKRRFTLVAKTLQNLSNFALFGKKEPFMEPMNEFINSKMDDMRKFINDICKPVDYKPVPKDILPEEVAKDTTDLIRYVALSTDKLATFQPPSELISAKLPQAIADIEKKIRKYDKDFSGF